MQVDCIVILILEDNPLQLFVPELIKMERLSRNPYFRTYYIEQKGNNVAILILVDNPLQ